MGLSNSELLAKRKWFIQGEDLNDLRDEPMTKKKFKIIAKSLSLGVPYASNIGGLATLTGNTSNLILAGEFSESFPLAPPITYTSWLLYNLPASFFFIWFAYLWIMVLMFGADKEDMSRAWKFQMTRQERKTSIFIENQFRDLGSWRMSEIEVGIVFVLTILLWFFEDPGFMPGWAELFRPNFVSNSQPAIFMGVLLFILPEESPFAVFEMSQAEIDESIAEGITIDPQSGDVSGGDPWQPVKAILDWHFVEKHVPWGVVFLMGGGFSLAFCSKQAGFSCWMAQNFSYRALDLNQKLNQIESKIGPKSNFDPESKFDQKFTFPHAFSPLRTPSSTYRLRHYCLHRILHRIRLKRRHLRSLRAHPSPHGQSHLRQPILADDDVCSSHQPRFHAPSRRAFQRYRFQLRSNRDPRHSHCWFDDELVRIFSYHHIHQHSGLHRVGLG